MLLIICTPPILSRCAPPFRFAPCRPRSWCEKKRPGIQRYPGANKSLYPRYHPHSQNPQILSQKHITSALRTDLLQPEKRSPQKIPAFFPHQKSCPFNRSAPECSLFIRSLKQRSQSVTPYSCQVPWTRVSFIAFILFHMITYHFFNYKPHFYEIYLLLRCKNLMHNAFLINIAIKNSTGATLTPHKEVIWKHIENTTLWALQRRKDSVEGRNAFYAVFLYVQK